MDKRFSAFSCNMVDKKRMKVKFPRKTQTSNFIQCIGHFTIASIRTFLIIHDILENHFSKFT